MGMDGDGDSLENWRATLETKQTVKGIPGILF